MLKADPVMPGLFHSIPMAGRGQEKLLYALQTGVTLNCLGRA
jgi:hypothetical protein